MSRQTRKNDDDEQIGSFYMGRMRPPVPKPRRQLPRGLLATIVILSFIGILWYAYPQGQEKYDNATVPLIAADTNPYKFKPEDPGGLEVLHQDSTVFNPIEHQQAAAVEKLMPLPEEPVNKTEVIEAAKARSPIETKEPELNLDLQMQKISKDTEKVVTKAEAAAAREKSAAKKAAAKKEDGLFEKEDGVADTQPQPQPVTDLATMPLKPQPKPKTLQQEPAPAAAADESPAPTGAPPVEAVPVYLRLGSYRTEAGANEDWRKLSAKYPQYLKNLTARILRTDLGPRGIYYRLEVGKLADIRAKQICDIMTSANPGGCIIVR